MNADIRSDGFHPMLPPDVSGGDYPYVPVSPLRARKRRDGRYDHPAPCAVPFKRTWLYAAFQRFHVPPTDVLELGDLFDQTVFAAARRAAELHASIVTLRAKEAMANESFNEQTIEPRLRELAEERKAALAPLTEVRDAARWTLAQFRLGAARDVPNGGPRSRDALMPDGARAAKLGLRFEQMQGSTNRVFDWACAFVFGSIWGWSFFSFYGLVELDDLLGSSALNLVFGSALGTLFAAGLGMAVRYCFKEASTALILDRKRRYVTSLAVGIVVGAFGVLCDVCVTGMAFLRADDLGRMTSAVGDGTPAASRAATPLLLVGYSAVFLSYVACKMYAGWVDDRSAVLNLLALKAFEAKSDTELCLEGELGEAEKALKASEDAFSQRESKVLAQMRSTEGKWTPEDEAEYEAAYGDLVGAYRDWRKKAGRLVRKLGLKRRFGSVW